MKYVIVMPAYNEEGFIGRAIESIAAQTLIPQRLVIVNDGSTDRTRKIVEGYQQTYPWIQLVNNDKKEQRAAGSKVVRAFYLGYQQIQDHYDFLVKLDADLTLPTHYFERIASLFRADPKLGIAGGTIAIEENGEWVYENFSDVDHVKGAFKSYRRACFEQIGGLRASIGWDTADELLARFHGWGIQVDPELQVRHYRVLGAETGSVKIRVKVGNGMYRLRYGFFITLISAIKAGYLNKPYGITGLAVLWGWVQSFLNQDEFIVTAEEGRFIRRFRKDRMRGKVFG
ncbi:MAG: glycosyltransferase family A protein [Phaeodactylibacter sp.]|uniref:glycosyltransferase family 2 protein n=1 Tax=Phaeodactylibacter sp. TaxID=1940289 RepID=UPI0032EB163F